MSYITPREISAPGMLKPEVWLQGVVVRIRTRILKDGATGADADKAGKGGKGGKPGKKGNKAGKKGGAADVQDRQGFELHLCGGDTPADVILLETLEPTVRARLQPKAQVGVTLRFTNT